MLMAPDRREGEVADIARRMAADTGAEIVMITKAKTVFWTRFFM